MTEMTEEQRQALEEKIKNMSPEELKEFQKKQCIFCQIIAGKVPSKKIYEDQSSMAVLDINPSAKGHILLLPKEHYAIMPQIPEKEITHLFLVSKYLSQTLLKVFRVGGTNMFIANGLAAGQRAQHFMIHLIPRKEGDELFPVQEKIIDKAMQEKVKMAVINRLNGVLGIKKEVVASAPVVQRIEENIILAPEQQGEVVKEESSEKSSSKEKKKKQQPKDEQKKDDVSLDDIADLFK